MINLMLGNNAENNKRSRMLPVQIKQHPASLKTTKDE
jgi:hypothetical protein